MVKAKTKGKYETVVKVLPVELTDKEVQERGEKLAELEQDAQECREEAAANAARYRERKKALAEQIAKVSKCINDGKEDRQVTCDLVPDYRRNLMEIVRQDTNEAVDSRALTADERQMELGGKKAAATETDGASDEDEKHEAAAPEPEQKPKRKPRPVQEANGVAEEAGE